MVQISTICRPDREEAAVSQWDGTTFESKENLLRVVRREAEGMFALAEKPDVWEAPTACTEWQVRDIIGHLVDTTEGYFKGFEAARGKGTEHDVVGLQVMQDQAGEGAIAFRSLAQEEMMRRVRDDFEKMMGIVEALEPEEWGGLTVTHHYMGPLPAFFYPAGQLMDYAVHSWDIRQGAGGSHALDGDAADLLVPFMFVLWQATVKGTPDEPYTIGIRVTSGANAGDYRVSVGADGLAYEPGSLDDLPAVIEFDAGSLVLTAFGRANCGTIRGDRELAERHLNLFFRI
jgi:uncharacterized protein (TIGR03083 family)